MMNAIELLKSDHEKVRKLLSELSATTSRGVKKRKDLLAKISSELKIHTALEEEIFYPAFKKAGKKAGDNELYYEALEEHRAAEDLILPDLESVEPNSHQFAGRAKVLKEVVEHHAHEEEEELFPRAQKLLGKDALERLGEEMDARKRELSRS